MDFKVSSFDVHIASLKNYINNNLFILGAIVLILIAEYGFELFNLNLTIDEEVHAFSSQADAWIRQGRWGMYLLNRFLFPQPVIPFVPLFFALVFHVFAILLLLNCWEVESKLEKLLIAAIGVAYPGMTYMYTFSTINYGIGIGLFLVALALFVYVRSEGVKRYFAVIPAAISISIYQGFAVALAIAFLVHFISMEIKAERRNVNVNNLMNIIAIGVLSASTYYIVQKTFLLLTSSHIGYIDTFFDINYLKENYSSVNRQVLGAMMCIYYGSPSYYAIDVFMLGVVMVVAIVGIIAQLIQSILSIPNKIVIGVLCFLVMLLPFSSAYLMRGLISMRFLVALPIVFSGLVMIALRDRSRAIKLFATIPIALCVFQFTVSANALFASSHLALQADRVLAGRILEHIESAKEISGSNELKYFEVIGYLNRPSTRLIPKIETFGASYFEWDQGNANRILLFLKTLGFEGLQALPTKYRGELMDVSRVMPAWPGTGSVKVFGNTVVLKFGPYSTTQLNVICDVAKNPKYCN